jgi:hypothetical protein
LTAHYGNDIVVESPFSVKEYNDVMDSEGVAGVRNLAREIDMDLPRKTLREKGMDKLIGIECRCKFCTDAFKVCKRPRSKLFMVDDHGIDYQALSAAFFATGRRRVTVRERLRLYGDDRAVLSNLDNAVYSARQALMYSLTGSEESMRRCDRRRQVYAEKVGKPKKDKACKRVVVFKKPRNIRKNRVAQATQVIVVEDGIPLPDTPSDQLHQSDEVDQSHQSHQSDKEDQSLNQRDAQSTVQNDPRSPSHAELQGFPLDDSWSPHEYDALNYNLDESIEQDEGDEGDWIFSEAQALQSEVALHDDVVPETPLNSDGELP